MYSHALAFTNRDQTSAEFEAAKDGRLDLCKSFLDTLVDKMGFSKTTGPTGIIDLSKFAECRGPICG